MNTKSGFSLLELLVVIAVLGVAFGMAALAGRGIAQNARERAALNTVQQVVWQGSTMAAARGFRTALCRDDTELSIRRVDDPLDPDCDGAVLRRFEIDREVVLLGIDDGLSLVFTPPGTILEGTRPDEITLSAAGRLYTLEVSLIGEVRAQ